MTTDTQLKNAVLDELKWVPSVNSNKIGVIVKDGSVALTGTVHTYAEKLAAERATKCVEGVRAIAQEIEVELPSSLRGTDENIAEQISHILKWNTALKDLNLQARVSNGFVTLDGEVSWSYQKQAAARQVEGLVGVTGIFNNITVKLPVTRIEAADIKKQINRALHRRANLEASKVHLSIADGKVTIEGTVDSYYERELIEGAVWACGGVKSVDDRLHVS